MRQQRSTVLPVIGQIVTILVFLAGCTPLTDADRQRMDAYRASQKCCGGTGP